MNIQTGTGRPTWQDRVGALSGAAYVLLILVGNQLAEGSGSSTHQTGSQVLAHLDEQASSTSAQIGLTLEVVGFVCFAFFLAWLYAALRRAGSGWPAMVALIGGVTTLAIKMSSGAVAVTLTTDRKMVDPQMAMVLNDLNSAAFVVSFITTGIFMLGIGLALLESRMLGRFAAGSAVLLGAAGIVLTLVTQADPITSNPLPFLLGLVWILVVGVRLAVREPSVGARGALAGAARSA